MEINSSMRNMRYVVPQKKIEEDLLEEKNTPENKERELEARSQQKQEQSSTQNYARASRDQYLANMNINFVSTTNKTQEEKQIVETNINSRTSVENSKKVDTQIQETKVSVNSQTAKTVAKTVTNGQNVLGDLYASSGELAEELAVMSAQNSALPVELADGVKKLGNLAKDTEAFQSALSKYADNYMVQNNIQEITTENVGEVMKSFFSDELGINLANIGKYVGGAAIASLAIRVGISTLIDMAPKIGKDVINLGKDTVENLLQGDVLGLIENALIDAPVMVIRNAARTVKYLAINTYETVKDVVVAGGEAVYGVAKAAVTGVVDTVSQPIKSITKCVERVGKGIVSGVDKMLDGNLIGGTAKIVGGVLEGAGNVVVGAVKTVGKAVKTVAQTIGKVASGVGKVVESVFGNPIKAVGGVVKSVGKAIKKIFSGW